MKIQGAYNCSYCHGNTDNACTACDPECDCMELQECSNCGEIGGGNCEECDG